MQLCLHFIAWQFLLVVVSAEFEFTTTNYENIQTDTAFLLSWAGNTGQVALALMTSDSQPLEYNLIAENITGTSTNVLAPSDRAGDWPMWFIAVDSLGVEARSPQFFLYEKGSSTSYTATLQGTAAFQAQIAVVSTTSLRATNSLGFLPESIPTSPPASVISAEVSSVLAATTTSSSAVGGFPQQGVGATGGSSIQASPSASTSSTAATVSTVSTISTLQVTSSVSKSSQLILTAPLQQSPTPTQNSPPSLPQTIIHAPSVSKTTIIIASTICSLILFICLIASFFFIRRRLQARGITIANSEGFKTMRPLTDHPIMYSRFELPGKENVDVQGRVELEGSVIEGLVDTAQGRRVELGNEEREMGWRGSWRRWI